MATPLPHVSVILPARNDAKALPVSVASALSQRYGGVLDVAIAVGPSEDGTEEVAHRLAAAHANVTAVANPSGGTAAGLDVALEVATGDVIVRVDARSQLPANYVGTAVEALRETGAANVGGIQAAAGGTSYERAVAAAMTSRFGVGDAKFHYGGAAGPTDTVYLGVFDAEVLRSVGAFDETLGRNQDYELNWRLREAGHTVWFEPDLMVAYQPRSSPRALASQYFQYGQWKREVARRHPASLRPRQVVAPLTLVGVAAGLAGAALGKRWMAAGPAVYGAAVLSAATMAGRSAGERARLLHVFPTMHLCWGAGFLVGPGGARTVPSDPSAATLEQS